MSGRRRIALFTGCLLLAAGAALFAWPAVNAFLYGQGVPATKEAFMQDVREAERVDAVALSSGDDVCLRGPEGLYEHLLAENERLYSSGQEGLVDAFSYEQPAVDLSLWGLFDNLVGFVSIPAIDLELPIYLGANAAQMAKGVVHLTQTSYPVGGANANCVLAAHRGTWDGLPMFRDLGEVAVGDEVIVENFRERLEYRVCEIRVIQPDDMDQVLIQEGRDLVTLLTCTPLGSNRERLAVYCERASDGPTRD